MEEAYVHFTKWKKPIWRLRAVWFQLCDSLEKAELWRQEKISGCRGQGRGNAEVEHRGV